VSTNYLTNVYDATSGKVTSQTDFQGRQTTFDYTVPARRRSPTVRDM
jgi:hypothetical protein